LVNGDSPKDLKFHKTTHDAVQGATFVQESVPERIEIENALFREIEDVDTAIGAGPSLRWAAMRPNMLFHLAAGKGGLASYCEHSFNYLSSIPAA
jgi:hypothetical protein